MSIDGTVVGDYAVVAIAIHGYILQRTQNESRATLVAVERILDVAVTMGLHAPRAVQQLGFPVYQTFVGTLEPPLLMQLLARVRADGSGAMVDRLAAAVPIERAAR